MIVCICHRISDRDIARAARGGCASFEDLQDELRVATACGACRNCARKTFDDHVVISLPRARGAAAAAPEPAHAAGA